MPLDDSASGTRHYVGRAAVQPPTPGRIGDAAGRMMHLPQLEVISPSEATSAEVVYKIASA
jgi:hypothetical protein